jgi:hypothetical protein
MKRLREDLDGDFGSLPACPFLGGPCFLIRAGEAPGCGLSVAIAPQKTTPAKKNGVGHRPGMKGLFEVYPENRS